MKIFIAAVILFAGEVPTDSRIVVATSPESCEQMRARIAEAAKANAMDVWIDECREVKRDVKPQVDPKHRDPKSEVRS